MQYMINSNTAWETFYSSTAPKESIFTDDIQKNPTENSIYIVHSFFNGLSPYLRGVCISVTNPEADILVEDSSFVALSSDYIAALELSVKNVVYNRVCGFNCSTTNTGLDCIFDASRLSDDIENMNRIYMSSFVHCINKHGAFNTLYRRFGQAILYAINASHNECSYCPAIYIQSSHKEGNISASLSYSTICNNTANPQCYCIRFESSGTDVNNIIQSANILDNAQKTNGMGLITTYGRLTINGTCIINNEAVVVLWVANPYTITLINSVFDRPSNTAGIVATVNAPVSSFLNGIHITQTGACVAPPDYNLNISVITPPGYNDHILVKTFCGYKKTGCQGSPYSIGSKALKSSFLITLSP